MTDHDREAVGQPFDPARMQYARAQSWAALHGIRERMHRASAKTRATAAAADVFRDLGMERLWHPPYVRIGPNTTKTYRERSVPGVRLGESDIFFIDLGPGLRWPRRRRGGYLRGGSRA